MSVIRLSVGAAKWHGVAFALAVAVALSGCSVTPMRGPVSALLGKATHAYHGRFAIQYIDRYGKERNVYGNFDWQEHGNTITLQLLTPLGQTLAVVTSSAALATLELPNREPASADNVAILMQNALGFALPVEGLRYWLRPLPSPTSRAITVTDPQHETRLKEIDQDGWTINYIAYADAPATGIKRLNLTRQDPPLDIKLVLDQ
jgi:outer membrane lipoprotein LolB